VLRGAADLRRWWAPDMHVHGRAPVLLGVQVKRALLFALVLGCGGQAYDEPAPVVEQSVADAGVPLSPDYWWCKGAGWPEVPRCKDASELGDGN
jgi:hypothetical protein